MLNGKWTTDGKHVTYNRVLTSEEYTKVFSTNSNDLKIIEEKYLKANQVQKIPRKNSLSSSDSEEDVNEESAPKPALEQPD